jgi:hypothetical protein
MQNAWCLNRVWDVIKIERQRGRHRVSDFVGAFNHNFVSVLAYASFEG